MVLWKKAKQMLILSVVICCFLLRKKTTSYFTFDILRQRNNTLRKCLFFGGKLQQFTSKQKRFVVFSSKESYFVSKNMKIFLRTIFLRRQIWNWISERKENFISSKIELILKSSHRIIWRKSPWDMICWKRSIIRL